MSAYDPKYIKLPPSAASSNPAVSSRGVVPVMTSTGEVVTLLSGDIVTQPYVGE